MIDERFIYLAIALDLFGGLSYLIDTIKGVIKPNKVTWFLWALAPAIAFIAQLSQGAGLISFMTLAVGITPFLVFTFSLFNRKTDWTITRFDMVCGALSLIGLLLWGITRVGNLAILFSILADGFAALPTIVKSCQAPETENSNAYLFAMLGAVITLFTIKQWDFTHSAFTIYIAVICLIIYMLIKLRLGKKINV